MKFQPLGYHFEIESPLPPAKVKAAIRSRTKGWFDPKSGPRGWIVGRLICLWTSAFDRHGPMLFGWLSHGHFGTRVSGRAGSDLNGILALALWLPLMLFVTYMAIREDQLSSGQLGIILLLVLFSPLAFWLSHKERKHAEPLVRFIRNTITPPGQSLRAKSASAPIAPQVRMTISGQEQPGSVTAEAVHDALLHLGVADSLILENGPETYIQTLLQEDGFVLEKRDGSRLHHYKAARPRDATDQRSFFTFEEVLVALIAYGSGSPVPDVISWESMELAE